MPPPPAEARRYERSSVTDRSRGSEIGARDIKRLNLQRGGRSFGREQMVSESGRGGSEPPARAWSVASAVGSHRLGRRLDGGSRAHLGKERQRWADGRDSGYVGLISVCRRAAPLVTPDLCGWSSFRRWWTGSYLIQNTDSVSSEPTTTMNQPADSLVKVKCRRSHLLARETSHGVRILHRPNAMHAIPPRIRTAVSAALIVTVEAAQIGD